MDLHHHSVDSGNGPHDIGGETSIEGHDQLQPAKRRSDDASSRDNRDSHVPRNESSSSATNQPQREESTTSSKGTSDSTSSHIPDVTQISEVDIKFLEAARKGDAKALGKAIDRGAEPKAMQTLSEGTVLHIACLNGHETIIQELLVRGLFQKCMKVPDLFGCTPLLSTCLQNNEHAEKVVKLLLQHRDKFDINAYHINSGDTALHLACLNGSEKVIEQLLEAKAEPDLKDYHGSTPLTLACQYSSVKVVEKLLKYKARVNIVDGDGDTPLLLAIEFGDVMMVKKVLEYNPDCSSTKASGQDAFDYALVNKPGDEIIPLLLYRGRKIDYKNVSKVFRQAAGDYLGDDQHDNVWGKTVQAMLKEHDLNPDKEEHDLNPDRDEHDLDPDKEEHDLNPDRKIVEAIKPLLKFASKEEKVFAVLEADDEAHFEILSNLTKEELGLRKDICKYIRCRDADLESEAFRDLIPSDTTSDFTRQFPLGSRSLVAKKGIHIAKQQKPITKLQVSAYHGQYMLVWYLLKKSQSRQKEDIREAIEIAKDRGEMARHTKQTKSRSDRVSQGQPRDPPSHKTKPKKPSPDEDPRRYELTIDILQNAKAWVSTSTKLPRRPKTTEMQDKKSLLQQHHATVVDFYEQNSGAEGQTNLLRASPSVFDLVYADNGKVDDIMKSAKSTFNEVIRTANNRKISDKDKPQLRWIHLPANHIDWMEHLTLRLYENSSESLEQRQAFFDLAQRSHVELPQDESKFKFMKPICLKKVIPQRPKGSRRGSKEPSMQQAENRPNSMGKNDQFQDEHPNDEDPRKDDGKGENSKDGDLEGGTPEDGSEENSHQQVRHAGSRAIPSAAMPSQRVKKSLETPQENPKRALQRLAFYTPYITFGYCYKPQQILQETKYSELRGKYPRSILHGSRSLDRFYYNALSDDKMQYRDKSQVVTRGLLKDNSIVDGMVAEGTEKWPYLAVEQLWVWVIDDKTIISSSTQREDGFDDLFVDKIFEQLRKGRTKGSGQKTPSSAIDMSHFLFDSCVDFVNNLTWNDACEVPVDLIKDDAKNKPVILFYADSVNKAMAIEKDLFQDFKDRIKTAKDITEARTQERKNHVPQHDIQDKENLEQDTKDWTAINSAATLLDEVKDIREELVILRFLVAQQEDVWNELLDSTMNSHDARSPSFTANQLDEMIKTTNTIQTSINDLLNLEESSIDIRESMMSREQSATLVALGTKADQQSAENDRQGKILKIFTVVTVVFTPLSFLASFYAVNTTTSRHNDGGELEYEPEWINQRIYGISAAIVGPLLIFAFFGEMKNLPATVEKLVDRTTWRWLIDLQWILGLIQRMQPVVRHKPAGKHRFDRRREPDIVLEEGSSVIRGVRGQT